MLLPALFLLAAPIQQGYQTDTTFAVSQGTRLSVENQGGDIIVRAWDRNQVRVQAKHSRRTHIDVSVSGAVVRLEAEAGHGPANMVDYEITVPVWMGLNLEGMYATVDVSGVRGAVVAETLEGDITVKGPAESVRLESVQGRIMVEGTRGSATLTTVSEGIEASDILGDIVASSVSGDILLRRVDAKSVEAETVSGEILLDSKLAVRGNYSLISHSGGLIVSVPEGANATIATAVGSGSVRASFSLPSGDRPSRRRQTFVLGNGSASVELETFSGGIALLRPEEVQARWDRMSRARPDQERIREKMKTKPDGNFDDDHTATATPRS